MSGIIGNAQAANRGSPSLVVGVVGLVVGPMCKLSVVSVRYHEDHVIPVIVAIPWKVDRESSGLVVGVVDTMFTGGMLTALSAIHRSGRVGLGPSRLGYRSYRPGNKPGVSQYCGWRGRLSSRREYV